MTDNFVVAWMVQGSGVLFLYYFNGNIYCFLIVITIITIITPCKLNMISLKWQRRHNKYNQNRKAPHLYCLYRALPSITPLITFLQREKQTSTGMNAFV